ncbi:TPA: hypothetical protein ACH3X1_001113 [Trebouxia sp. C0004]
MGVLTDLLLGFQGNERAARRTLPFFRSDGMPRYKSLTFREAMLRHYQQADQPRVPAPANVTPNSIVLLLMLFKVIKSVEGITGLPAGTKLLLAANCLPFLKPNGFSLPTFGLSPFMVWEQRQFYRVLTAGFLHADFDHMVSNASSLVISSSYLERGLTRLQFAATMASLALSSHGLYVLSSWVDCCWFGLWRQYFLEGAVGASGLGFAMQVVADNMRGSTVSVFGISGLEAPAKFSCWISLAVTQILVPQASFTGHLCGVLAGLLHVYIPKAGMIPVINHNALCKFQATFS